MIIFQYISFERNFDQFHENNSQIYRVLPGFGRGGEPIEFGGAFTPQSMAPLFKESVPEIQHISRVHSDNALVFNSEQPEKVFEEGMIYYADPDFLDIFSFPLISGSKDEALQKGTAVISEEAAQKYFGTDNAIGEVISVIGQVQQDYRIAGIFSGVPDDSHLQFDILLPMDNLLESENYSTEPEGGWSWNNFSTYLQLHPEANPVTIEQKLTELFLSNRGGVLKQQGYKSSIKIQPLEEIHLNAQVQGPLGELIGSSRTVYFFTIIGLVTFFIALINYINLATARALNRAREVGVRKVLGAQKNQLIIQFLFDAALTNVVALVFAFVATAILIPFVNNIAQSHLSIDMWMQPDLWITLLVTLISSILLSGLYPAFILSSFRPVTVLKGKLSMVTGQVWLRKGLVVLQFAASIVLISGTLIIYNQLNHMRDRDLGLNMDGVLIVKGPRNLPQDENTGNPIANFLQELRKLPEIEQAAVSASLPGQGFNWNGASIRKASDEPKNSLRGVATYIDTSFAKLYKLELVAGKGFENVTFSDDPDAIWNVTINETLTKALGYEAPDQVLNELLMIGDYEAQVVGVYKDFNWSSAHQEQQNIVFGHTSGGRHISLKLSTNDLPTVISKIEVLYSGLFPANVFDYQFLDQAFDQQYKNDIRFAKLFGLFAGLAIFIACLGLYGLVSFTSQQRKKEVGVRKVLGASVGSVVKLLNIDFLKLVGLGFIVAVPIAWYFMHQWLQEFAYRIDIGISVFVIAGLTAFIIAVITISGQSIKDASANPVESLRNE
jgi:putative ABC transport system permease protein